LTDIGQSGQKIPRKPVVYRIWGLAPCPIARYTVGYRDRPVPKDITNGIGVVKPKALTSASAYRQEKALLDICLLRRTAGNRVRVYRQLAGERNVMPRLQSVVEHRGLDVSFLRADDLDPNE
jgi:hypothetical protein